MIEKIIIDGKGTERRIYPPVDLLPEIQRPEITTYEEALEWNKLAQEHSEGAMIFTQEYAKVECHPRLTNRIFLANISDLHFGHHDVDYDFLDKSIKTIQYTPDMKGILGWNILDAAIPAQFPDGLLWSGQSAQEQTYTFREKLQELHRNNKLVAGIGEASCHEGWLKKRAGWMVYRELFEGIDDVPLLLNGGYLEVVVGAETYRLALFHKTRYWSTLNKSHGGQRMLDRIADAEIVFTSHMHRASVEQSQRYNPPFTKATAIVSSGTCKLRDRWQRGNAGEEGEKGFQGIMLWADKHKFQVVYDLEVGRELMIDAIRDEEAKKLQLLREELGKIKAGFGESVFPQNE